MQCNTAFVIKMPIMHRLACLRDDVVFLIFCYQRYKYRTDFSRVNEFGQCEDPTEEMLQEQEAEKETDETVTISHQVQDGDDNSALTGETDTPIPFVKESDTPVPVVKQRRGAKDKKQPGAEN